jgi:hypothetical protein
VRDRPSAAMVSRGTQDGRGSETDLELPKRDGCWTEVRHDAVGKDHEEEKAQEGTAGHRCIKRAAMSRRILTRTKTLKTKKDVVPVIILGHGPCA